MFHGREFAPTIGRANAGPLTGSEIAASLKTLVAYEYPDVATWPELARRTGVLGLLALARARIGLDRLPADGAASNAAMWVAADWLAAGRPENASLADELAAAMKALLATAVADLDDVGMKIRVLRGHPDLGAPFSLGDVQAAAGVLGHRGPVHPALYHQVVARLQEWLGSDGLATHLATLPMFVS